MLPVSGSCGHSSALSGLVGSLRNSSRDSSSVPSLEHPLANASSLTDGPAQLLHVAQQIFNWLLHDGVDPVGFLVDLATVVLSSRGVTCFQVRGRLVFGAEVPLLSPVLLDHAERVASGTAHASDGHVSFVTPSLRSGDTRIALRLDNSPDIRGRLEHLPSDGKVLLSLIASVLHSDV